MRRLLGTLAVMACVQFGGNAAAQDDARPEPVLPAGTRAVSIKVPENKAGGGFVLPGSRVDVVRLERKAKAQAVAKNLLVVAVDLNTQANRAKYVVVVVAVPENEAAAVARVAVDNSRLQLLLARPSD